MFSAIQPLNLLLEKAGGSPILADIPISRKNFLEQAEYSRSMVISHQLFNYLILLKKQQHHDHLSLRNSSQQSDYEKFMKGFMSHIWATLKARSKKPFQNFDPQVLPEGNKDLIDRLWSRGA